MDNYEKTFLLFCVVITIIGLSVSFLQNEKHKTSWKELDISSQKIRPHSRKKKSSKTTDSNTHLTFMESQSLKGAYVTGIYRGYNLTLDSHTIFPAKVYQVYTRFTLSAINPSSNLDPIEIQPSSQKQISPEYITQMLLGTTKLDGEIKIEERARKICFEKRNIIEDPNRIRRIFDLLCDLGDSYDKVLMLGNNAEPSLRILSRSRGHILQHVATQLLSSFKLLIV